MLLLAKRDPTLSYSYDVLKAIFLVRLHSKEVEGIACITIQSLANGAIAKAMEDQYPYECSDLQAKDVENIYNYILKHPEYDIHKQWVNCGKSEPELVQLVEDYDSKIVALWDRYLLRHRIRIHTGTPQERLHSLSVYFRGKSFYC